MKYNEIRRKTRKVTIKDVSIGADSDILIQSMTNTDTLDKSSTLKQVLDLEKAGADIVRITVPNIDASYTIEYLKDNGVKVPIVADIHFDYRIALECAKLGVDKIRINPGNIGEDWKVKEVINACKHYGIPIRIGVNGGSLEKHILDKYKSPTPEALAESAFYHIDLLEKYGFNNTVISVKSSNVINMINANKIIAKNCDYPIHLGVTEAGDSYSGLVKSCVGIGSLLCEGIGDTIRVSLTANPVEEIKAGKELLSSIGFYNKATIEVVSCPTCGRTKIDLIDLSNRLKKEIENIDVGEKNIKIALMGCIVNGPGEAKECDFGIAGAVGEAVLFRKGEIVSKIKESEIIPTLLNEIERFKNQ